jgi:hypothetical protein
VYTDALRLRRDLREFQLRGATHFEAWARTDRDATYGIQLLEGDGSAYQAAVSLKASADFRRFYCPLDRFVLRGDSRDENGRLDMDQAVEMEWGNSSGVPLPPNALCIQKLGFGSEAPGPRVGRISIRFELGKLLQVGLPCLAGFGAFVALAFVLRLREAADLYRWLRTFGRPANSRRGP